MAIFGNQNLVQLRNIDEHVHSMDIGIRHSRFYAIYFR